MIDKKTFAVSKKAIDGVRAQIAEKTTYGIASGLEVTAQDEPDMTVAVSAGVAYATDGTRHAVEAATMEIDTADVGSARKDLIYVDADGAVAYLAGQPLAPAIPGARLITIAVNGAAGDIVTFDEETFEAVDAAPGEGEFLLGATPTETATNLAGFIDGRFGVESAWAFTVDGATILIAEKAPGAGDDPPAMAVTGTMEITQEVLSTSTPAVESVEPPLLPPTAIPLAMITVRAAATDVVTADITDLRRAVLDMPYTDADGEETTVSTRLKTHDTAIAQHGQAITEMQNTGVDTTARTAAGTALTDADEHFASENVEGALGEVGTALGTVTSQLAEIETYFLTGTDDYGTVIDDPTISLDWGTL
jgi:hypothetical protein